MAKKALCKKCQAVTKNWPRVCDGCKAEVKTEKEEWR